VKIKYIQIVGTVATAVYFVFVAFLYLAEPRSLADISTKAVTTVQDAVTKGTVITGTYEIDRAKFNEALALFRQDNFVAARDLFQKADPERRDAVTQYYIAYTYYRQGWGRVSNDDELFAAGLKQLDVVDKLDANFIATDDDLKLKRPAELRHELEEGRRITADDFNPLKLVRERK
jgi:ABC-type oligopeptide transport system substrate-binding subunit